ncbi:ABC transporter permease [Corynebacterium sphenisci]|uniref:ABC transporter permease n=1 Tax=Corynebacterium sphenisci TaxID=191493 RepID=UPI0026DEA50B|nr:ABC transporter permease [Corynebacterium sphenisci]MDO5730979.1 ABC transporter permease [Corynebacterium sphenisci]
MPEPAAVRAHLGRLLTGWSRDRVAIANTILNPILMLLVVRLLFGDLIRLAQGAESLDPLPLTVMMIFATQAMNSVEAAAHGVRERRRGLVARVAVTPGGIGPLIAGRWLFDWLRTTMSGAAALLVGVVLGVRVHTWAAAGWLAAAILVGGIFAATLAMLIGALAATPEATMAATPLLMAATFLNGGMVPPERFVAAAQPIARNNPVNHLVEAALAFNGSPLADTAAARPAWTALAWLGGLTAVAGIAAIRPLRRRLV